MIEKGLIDQIISELNKLDFMGYNHSELELFANDINKMLAGFVADIKNMERVFMYKRYLELKKEKKKEHNKEEK